MNHQTPNSKSLYHPALFRISTIHPDWLNRRFDGSCDRNGHPDAKGGWAYHIAQSGQTIGVGRGVVVANPVTNNISEWWGVYEGVLAVSKMEKPVGLHIEGDSQLVIFALTGRWGCRKEHLAAFRDRTRDLLAAIGCPWAATWIPREQNTFCDSLT